MIIKRSDVLMIVEAALNGLSGGGAGAKVAEGGRGAARELGYCPVLRLSHQSSGSSSSADIGDRLRE